MRRPRARASTCLSIGHGKEYDPGGLYDSGATLYLAFFPLSSSHVLSLCLCLCLFSRAHEREGRGKAYTNACMRVHASARARAKLVCGAFCGVVAYHHLGTNERANSDSSQSLLVFMCPGDVWEELGATESGKPKTVVILERGCVT